MASRNAAHEYDPSIVFHSHSSDLPHLNDWISELIAQSEESLPIQSNPTTEQLVQALQRYDSMFRELLRQTRYNESSSSAAVRQDIIIAHFSYFILFYPSYCVMSSHT